MLYIDPQMVTLQKRSTDKISPTDKKYYLFRLRKYTIKFFQLMA